MKIKTLFASALAVLGLTACEKSLDIGEDISPTGQVKNSVLQVRTRGSATGDEAAVSYPVTVYVFDGDECQAAGYGCVNPKQTEYRTVAPSLTVFDIYTLPHTEEKVLTKLTVTALDANDNTVKESTFENIPVTRNQITRYTGIFFGNGGSTEPSA